jgi:hypothetical protein
MISAGVLAADDAGSFVAYGHGNQPCSEWTRSRARNDANTIRMTAWTLGYITAYNTYLYRGLNVARDLDAGDIHFAIDKHCRARPFDNLSFATNAVIEGLEKGNDLGSFSGLLDFWKPRAAGK